MLNRISQLVMTASVTFAVLSIASARAEEGGVKDSTGLVWSQSQLVETTSWWTWAPANKNAGSYSVLDYDSAGTPVLYDDWRLPTLREIQNAIHDGTMAQLMPYEVYTKPDGSLQYAPYYTQTWIWTADERGGKAWQIQIVRDNSGFPWPLIPEASGLTQLVDKRLNAVEVFFVRGKTPLK